MLEMKPVEDASRVLEWFEKEEISFREGCGAYAVSERGSLLGYCLFQMGKTMKILAVRCEEPALLDALLRAALNHGSLSQAVEADFSALLGPMREKLEQLGYLKKDPLPIEWFFAACKPCKGMA